MGVGHGGRFPRGSGKPYDAIWERRLPPPASLACGSLRPRPHRPAALRLENDTTRKLCLADRAGRGEPSAAYFGKSEEYRRISIGPAGGRDFGNSHRARAGRRAAQELQHSGPKGKRDRLPPWLALRSSRAGG